MKYIRIFSQAVIAGLLISIGGCVYLSLENRIAGAIFFSVGLYGIVLQGLCLYTGKIGYLILEKDKISYMCMLAVTWVGNLAGTFIGSAMLLSTRVATISQKACTIVEPKLADSLISIFMLAVFCGLLMYLGVDGYRDKQNPLIVIFCVSVFILCGFEHCIANMFYISIAGLWSFKSVLLILVMTLGNSAGAFLIPLVKMYLLKEN